MERVRFITHNGHQVLFIDMSNLQEGECVPVIEQVMKLVTAQPKDSVLTLTDWAGCKPGKKDLTRMKEVAVLDRPYVKRAAFINGSHLPKVLQQNLQTFSQRTFAEMPNQQEALKWLTSDK